MPSAGAAKYFTGRGAGPISMISLSMQHPLLRIFAAVLIALWSPACCCRASAVFGAPCETVTVAEIPSDGGCDDGCCGNDSHDRSESSSTDHDPVDDSCPSCPSCLGLSGSDSLLNHSKADLDVGLSLLCVLAISTHASLSTSPIPPSVCLGVWSAPPPCARSNRETLRWHCALIV